MANAKNPLCKRDPMADCLRAQARICERIASECWNEETAGKFETLARKCNAAAAGTESENTVIQAVWPTGISAAGPYRKKA
jgi:hypothetical protein